MSSMSGRTIGFNVSALKPAIINIIPVFTLSNNHRNTQSFGGNINQAAQIKETRGHFALDTRIPTKGKSIVAHTDHITAQFIANTSALLRDQFTIVAVRHTFRAGEYSRNILFEYFVSLLAL